MKAVRNVSSLLTFSKASKKVVETDVPLVFLPGVKGSTLVEYNSRRQVYFTGEQALGLSHSDIRLPLDWHYTINEAGKLVAEQYCDDLVPGEPLRSLTLSSNKNLVVSNVYAKFLDMCQLELHRPFYSFAYDWRRSNLETAVKFQQFVKGIVERHGQKVQVIGHSMGGLIAFSALNAAPHLFHSAVFAGTPFHPGIGYLTDTHQGLSLGLNSKMLSPSVMNTFPSSFCFFPLSPNAFQRTGSWIFDENGHPIKNMDFYRAEDWEKHKLGPFSDPKNPPSSQFIEHFEFALNDAKTFRQSIVYNPQVNYPNIAVLAARNRPCLTRVMKNGPKSIRGYDFTIFPKIVGDGRVPFHVATPPDGVPFHVYETDRRHSDILNDVEKVKGIVDSQILEADSMSLFGDEWKWSFKANRVVVNEHH